MIKLSTLAKEHFLIKEGTVKNAKVFDRLAYLILKNLIKTFSFLKPIYRK